MDQLMIDALICIITQMDLQCALIFARTCHWVLQAALLAPDVSVFMKFTQRWNNRLILENDSYRRINYMNLLRKAAQHGQLVIVLYILQRMLPMLNDNLSSYWITTLIKAAKHGHLEILEKCVSLYQTATVIDINYNGVIRNKDMKRIAQHPKILLYLWKLPADCKVTNRTLCKLKYIGQYPKSFKYACLADDVELFSYYMINTSHFNDYHYCGEVMPAGFRILLKKNCIHIMNYIVTVMWSTDMPKQGVLQKTARLAIRFGHPKFAQTCLDTFKKNYPLQAALASDIL